MAGAVQEAVGSVSAWGTRLAAVWPRPSKATLTLSSRCYTEVTENEEKSTEVIKNTITMEVQKAKTYYKLKRKGGLVMSRQTMTYHK